MATKRFVTKHGLDNNNQTITNVANPSTDTDAANKQWVTSQISNAGGGTVTSIGSTTLTTGGTSTVPTVNLTSGIVTAGTTGSASLIPVVTVDTYGRVTTITTAANPQGTVTSVTGTSPVASSGGTTPVISLNSSYGDTQNPYASKTANYVLAAPDGSAGVPTFRAIVAADIPTLNQNTTGSAGSVANTLTITSPLSGTSYNGSAAVSIGIPVATSIANGYLSSTDWSTFNSKGSGTVTSVTGTSPVVSSGGVTPAISMPAATTSVSGYLTSTDWTTFNNKTSNTGTVTSVTGGTYLTGGTITTTGTLAVDATSANTASKVVARDASGNFSAGTITASLSGNATNVTGTVAVANGGTSLTTLTSGSYVVGAGTSAVTLKTPTQVTADLDTFTYQLGATAGKKGLVPAAPAVGASVVYLDQTGAWTTPSAGGTTTNALTISSPLTGTSFNGSSAVSIGIPVATTSANGYLSSTDWTTFNNKGSGTVTSIGSTTLTTGGTSAVPTVNLTSGIVTAGTTGSASLIPVVTVDTYGRVTTITTAANPQGTVTSVTGTSPVVSSGGTTPAISMPAATTSVNGYLSSTDWTTFNNKGSGSVTSVTGGTYLTGGTITTTGTLAVDATSVNTASKVVARDASGNFSAGTITANLTGNASGSSGSTTGNAATATALQTARAINGVNFDGTAAITVTAAAGTLTGSTLASGVTASSLTSVGTLGSLTVSGNATFDTNTLFVDATNDRVGIGTTSPYNALEISGSSSRLGLNNGGGASRKALVIEPLGYGGNTYARLESYDYGTSTGGILALNVTGGNLGIGTASPNGVLTVFNATTFNARTSGINVHRPSAYGQYGSFAYDGDITYLSSTYTGGGAGTYGLFVFQGYDSTSTPREYLRILSNGNVGIGTASPTAKLDIGSNTTNAAQARFTRAPDTDFSLVAFNSNTTSNASGAECARFGLSYGLSNSTNFSAGFSFMRGSSAADGSLAILTNAAERMRIDSSGNVGIGTSSPEAKLDVFGSSFNLRPTNTNSIGHFNVTNGVGSPVSVRLAFGTDNTGWQMRFAKNYQGTYTDYMTIADNGAISMAGTLGVTGLATFSAGMRANGNSEFFNGQTSALSVENQSTFTRFAFNKLTFYDWNVGRDIVILDNAVKFQPNHGSTKLQDDTGVVINGNYTNGAYSTRFRKWDDGSGLPLYVQETKGTPNVWTNVARFGQGESGQMYDFQVYGNTRVETNLDAGYFTILADSNNQFTQGALQLRSSSPTIYLRDTDNNSAMLHCNGNNFYILRGGNDTTSWTTTNGNWPVYWDLTNNDATFGRHINAPAGSITAGVNITGVEIYSNGWFRNNNSGTGLYNSATGNHFYSDGQYWNAAYSGTQGIRFRNGHAGSVLGYLYAETNGYFGLLNNQGNWSLMSRPSGAGITLYGTEINVAQTLYVHEADNRTRVPRTFVQSGTPSGTITDGDVWLQY